jgi:hypothetical protein
MRPKADFYTKLTDKQKEICLGSLLGDMNINVNMQGKCRISMFHCLEQKEYLYWFYNELKNFVKTPPKNVVQHDKKQNRYYPQMRFSTLTYDAFGKLYDLCYSNDGKKYVTEEWLKLIKDSALALAIWYMDDGTLGTDNHCTLATCSFSLEEHDLLIDLLANWNLGVKVITMGKHEHIYFSVEEADAFFKIIKPFVLPSMQYKLGAKKT